MKKKQRNIIHAPEPGSDPLDWTPLFRAFREAFEWSLDVAANLAADYQEEAEAVERVRVFMRRRLAGIPAHVRIDDVLFVFGLIIGAIERDIGPVKNGRPWSGRAMRFPGAWDGWDDGWEPELLHAFMRGHSPTNNTGRIRA